MGLAKVAVQCYTDTFVVNQSLVLLIDICGENRHLRQARNRNRKYRLLNTITTLYSKRPKSITLFQAATKSLTNLSFPSSQP